MPEELDVTFDEGAAARAPGAVSQPHSQQQQGNASAGIGKYRLLAELGRGGMADVYLAVAAGPGGFNKLLVIKQLRALDDQMMLTMFLDEAKLAARVNHPNIVQTFEVAHEASRAYMVMEYLDGPSLSRLRRGALKKGTRVPLEIELHIMREALLGLHSAHELKGYDGKSLNVVHRDFTPQNIMTSFAGDAKIVDFGIAKALDQEGKTNAGTFKGKLSYSPPEQMAGEAVDRRTDIFAAGVMLFEAATGRSPWEGKNNAQIVHALAAGKIPQLIEDASVPPELAEIIDQAMAVDPDDRYVTADELRVALDGFIQSHGLQCDRAKMGQYITGLMGEVLERTQALIQQRLSAGSALPSADTLVQSLPTLDARTPSPAEKQVGRSLPKLALSDEAPDTNKRALTNPSGLETPVSVVTTMSPAARVAMFGLGAVVLGLVVVVGMLVMRGSSTPAAPQPTPAVANANPVPAPAPTVAPPTPAAVAEPAGAPPEAARTVTLRISASPANARLFLDDLLLPSNPYEGSFPADDRLHELKASAPGFTDVRRGIQYERDLSLDLSLSHVAAPPAPGRRPEAPPPVTKTATKSESADPEYFAPASGEKKKQQPKRSLDNVEFE